ncbi:MAG: hypothetical protein LBC42_03215 [Puniceicoccales bacterium]|jgi:hypothetical protein|nr:hypothetical protein [Puniceicoccales bacterium]
MDLICVWLFFIGFGCVFTAFFRRNGVHAATITFALFLQCTAFVAIDFFPFSGLAWKMHLLGIFGPLGFFPFCFPLRDDSANGKRVLCRSSLQTCYVFALYFFRWPYFWPPFSVTMLALLTIACHCLLLHGEVFLWRQVQSLFSAQIAWVVGVFSAYPMNFMATISIAGTPLLAVIALRLSLPNDATCTCYDLRGFVHRSGIRSFFIALALFLLVFSPATVLVLTALPILSAVHFASAPIAFVLLTIPLASIARPLVLLILRSHSAPQRSS